MVPSGTDAAPALEQLQRCTFCYGETHRDKQIRSGLLSVLSHPWQKQLELGQREMQGLGQASLGLGVYSASSTDATSQFSPKPPHPAMDPRRRVTLLPPLLEHSFQEIAII